MNSKEEEAKTRPPTNPTPIRDSAVPQAQVAENTGLGSNWPSCK